jgi:hypothetical protein
MTSIERSAFLKLFNRNGYVLDFSTNNFDIFTTESVGIPLCEKYGLSKGASLTAYCSDACEKDVTKLLGDLLEYYELYYHHRPGEGKNQPLFEKCQKSIEHENGSVRIETPAIVCVNRDYIGDISARAMRDVENGDYDSAITKSRTLLEEVFCYVIEQKGENPSESGDMGKLYNQVKTLYNMHQDKDLDKRINGLLSGLGKIINAISEMRNKGSDAHGVGSKRISIDEHHARLFVNSAMTIADFVLSVSHNQIKANKVCGLKCTIY